MKNNSTVKVLRIILSAINDIYPQMINNQVRDIKKTQDSDQKFAKMQKLINNPGFWNYIRKRSFYKIKSLFPTVSNENIEDACACQLPHG